MIIYAIPTDGSCFHVGKGEALFYAGHSFAELTDLFGVIVFHK
jgi:hypothetical protein